MYYLFHGPDEFTMREELARLERTGSYELNQEVFAGSEADLRSIAVACETLPFLSERRLVVVEGLPKRRRVTKVAEAGDQVEEPPTTGARRAAGRGKKTPAGAPDPRAFAQALADYAERLPATTDLVVLADELLDDAHPLVGAAARHGQVRAFVPPRGAQLESWMARRAQALGVRLDREAAQLLANAIGNDLRPLAGELAKLAAYVGQGGAIGEETVRLLSSTAQQTHVFDLTDALARRDRPRALALLHELLDAGESAQGIVALIAHQTRTLLQVRALAEQGQRPPQIAQTMGLAPFVVEKSLPLARRFSLAQLEAAHRALLSVDTALKLSKLTPEMALDLMIVEFGR
jgi:DNA polymerase-3 subunit delta